MTLIIGCGGSSSPNVTTCDGGACGDAKRDTSGAKLDGTPPNVDVARLDTQVTTPDGPVATHDGPAANTDGPAASIDGPAPTTDGPAPSLDGPAPTTDGQPPTDVTIVSPEVHPADVTPGEVAPPVDTSTPHDTAVAGDGKTDLPPISNPDAGTDGTVSVVDARADGGTDGTVAIIDGAADIGADAAPIIPDAAAADGPIFTIDASADTGPDGLIVTVDAEADAVADAPESDTPVGQVDGGASDGGGCSGDACHEFTFEGDNRDAGLPAGPTGFTAVGATDTWSLVMDGGNTVLEGTDNSGGVPYARTNAGPWNDQTIEVKVRFVTALAGNQVRICGRASDDLSTAYCIYVSIAAEGDAGATGGSMAIWKRQPGGGGPVPLGTTSSDLDISVGTWHTYRLTISGSTTVLLAGYLDDDPTARVTVSDGTGPLGSGQVALGVNTVTADFDNLIVSSP